MPHVIEPAASARAKCRGCGEKIAAGDLRFGESLPNPFAEGESFQWSHLECGAMKRPESFLEALAAQAEAPPDAPRLEALARQGTLHPRAARVSGAERDPSGRAACRHCRQRIEKGALRLSLVFFEDGRFTPAGSLHVACAGGYCGTSDLMPRIKRFAPGLGETELVEIETELQKPSPPAAAAPASETT
jgi:hypothetical protein